MAEVTQTCDEYVEVVVNYCDDDKKNESADKYPERVHAFTKQGVDMGERKK